jgi:hypothetical protein
VVGGDGRRLPRASAASQVVGNAGRPVIIAPPTRRRASPGASSTAPGRNPESQDSRAASASSAGGLRQTWRRSRRSPVGAGQRPECDPPTIGGGMRARAR